LAENAGFPKASKRGNYKLFDRVRTKQRIYQMILDGYTYVRIMKDLDISERTLYRYLDIIFAEEQDFLNEDKHKEELKRQINICRDRLQDDRRQLKEWVSSSEFKEKINAMHLAAELSAAVLRLYIYGPSYLARHHDFPRNSLTGQETTGLRLDLKRREEEAEKDSFGFT
jgi:Homeodomain-like domain